MTLKYLKMPLPTRGSQIRGHVGIGLQKRCTSVRGTHSGLVSIAIFPGVITPGY